MSGLLLKSRAGPLDDDLHFLRDHIGNRRENEANQSQPPVVEEQHACVGQQRHAGIEDFRREFPHALGAVVYVQNSLGHYISGSFLGECPAAFLHQTAVEGMLHPPVYIVGEAAHVEALNIAGDLHHTDGRHIGCDQRQHI